jgi:NTE family protein
MKGGRPHLPEGLNAAHQIGLLLDRVGLAYPNLDSFDDLPTPFRCVAADLLSGEKVVFRDGSLSQALRATMSLPAIFSPVPYGDMLLVDGGVVDNLPADIVRGMDVDVVIAVDLGMETIDKEADFSLLGVAMRSIDIMIRRNVIESLRTADLVVQPKVLDYGTLQFDDTAAIIERGYAAAESMADKLSPYAVEEREWQAYLATRATKTRAEGLEPAFIEVSGARSVDGEAIRESLLGFQEKPLEREELQRRLTRITGRGLYDAAGYRAVERENKTGLEVALSQKPNGPPFIRPLLILDSGQAGSASFTIAARITAYDLPTARSEWRTDFSLGRINAIASEYYQFVGSSQFFVAPRGFISREQQLITSDGERLADYKVSRTGGGLDLGYNFGRFSEIRTGLELAKASGEVLIGFNILPRIEGPERLWRSTWRLNALNSGSIPTRGVQIRTDLDWQFRSPTVFLNDLAPNPFDEHDAFGQARLQALYARQFRSGWSGLVRAVGGETFSGRVQPLSEFRLGGPLRLGALEVGELRGGRLAFGSVGILKSLHDSPTSIVSKLYGAVLYEAGDAFDSKPRWFHSGTAGVMAETSLGVLFLGLSYGESGRGGFFFALGRIFDSGVRDATQIR